MLPKPDEIIEQRVEMLKQIEEHLAVLSELMAHPRVRFLHNIRQQFRHALARHDLPGGYRQMRGVLVSLPESYTASGNLIDELKEYK